MVCVGHNFLSIKYDVEEINPKLGVIGVGVTYTSISE
jgi:hypothetical protein